jgi:hypothetical protein
MCLASDPIQRELLRKEPVGNATGAGRAWNQTVLRIREKNAVDPVGNKAKREMAIEAPVQNVYWQAPTAPSGSSRPRGRGLSRLSIGAAQ